MSEDQISGREPRLGGSGKGEGRLTGMEPIITIKDGVEIVDRPRLRENAAMSSFANALDQILESDKNPSYRGNEYKFPDNDTAEISSTLQTLGLLPKSLEVYSATVDYGRQGSITRARLYFLLNKAGEEPHLSNKLDLDLQIEHGSKGYEPLFDLVEVGVVINPDYVQGYWTPAIKDDIRKRKTAAKINNTWINVVRKCTDLLNERYSGDNQK